MHMFYNYGFPAMTFLGLLVSLIPLALWGVLVYALFKILGELREIKEYVRQKDGQQ
ncbi:MAG: hypothetical protein H0Z39_08890 [Peptococcaceae bacterium]|nr:hypothetical protein [Peptococcaceae bacterium]